MRGRPLAEQVAAVTGNKFRVLWTTFTFAETGPEGVLVQRRNSLTRERDALMERFSCRAVTDACTSARGSNDAIDDGTPRPVRDFAIAWAQLMADALPAAKLHVSASRCPRPPHYPCR